MNVVGYCRLSRDDKKVNYSSIEEQMEMIKEYALTKKWTISHFYIDDNISGYTFNRPGIQEVLDGLFNGNIDIVITKDSSRLGRKNGKTLDILDNIKEKGKNVIFLFEMGRVFNLQEDDSSMLGLNTWYNERYVKDISCKVKSSMHSRQKKGTLIMGNKFGYIKDKKEKGKLIVDEDISHIIQYIFNMYIQAEYGLVSICEKLNEKGYVTPSVYYQRKAFEAGNEYNLNVQSKWCTYMVKAILCNEIYTGTLITHKKECKTIKGNAKILPVSQHYRFENHHEAVISKEEFNLAQEIRKKRGNSGYNDSNTKNRYLFRGMITCGECGFSVSGKQVKRKNGNILTYACTNYLKYGNKRCNCGLVRENEILIYVKMMLKEIRKQYSQVLSEIKINDVREKKENMGYSLMKKQEKLECELNMLITKRIEDLVKELNCSRKEIIEKSFSSLIEKKTKEIDEVKEKLSNIHTQSVTENKIQTILDKFDELINTDKPSRYLLNMLINKIYIYSDKSIKIDLKVNIEELCI